MPKGSTFREPGAPGWRLPKVRDIQIPCVSYRPKQRRNFRSALSDYKEAVEFLVPPALRLASRVGEMLVTKG